MIVTATFLGSRADHGFRLGQEYTLRVHEVGNYLQVCHEAAPFQKVPYSSWATFLDCWGKVSKVDGPVMHVEHSQAA